jgi:ketosteroid isomerase-like protein
MKRLIISASILLLSLGYAKKKTQNAINTTNIEIMETQNKQEIETLLSNYKTSLNTSDTNKAVSLYTKNGVFMPSEGPSAIGTDQLKSAYDFVFSQIQLNIEEIVIEENLAFATTSSKGITFIHAIEKTVPEENRELFVFEKENGAGEIARYMFNKMSPQK